MGPEIAEHLDLPQVTYALEVFAGAPAPGATLTLAITRKDGSVTRTQVRSRIDTDDERDMFAAGGLLPRIANELLAAKG